MADRAPSRSRLSQDVRVALIRQCLRDARIRTMAFGYLFAVYSFVQPYGYRHTYPNVGDRLAFARSFGGNTGLRLLYGQPHDLSSVSGYSAWRVGGVLAIAAAGFGLLAAVRALRAEEDCGRTEIVLAGVVSRRAVNLAAIGAIGLAIALLWLAEFAGFVLGGLPTTGAAYLALASASVAPVFAGVGALASQLAPSRAGALGLASLVLALTLLARVLADTVAGAGWLRCLSPLGWAELLRPFAGPRPLVLLLPVLSTVLLLAVAARLAAGRDIGTGMLASRDRAEPRLRLLGSPIGLALRAQRSTLLSWLGAVAGFMFILGVVSHAISAADVPRNVQDEIAKLGAGSIVTPLGYLGLVFVFVMVAVCGFGCLQVGSARREEVGQQLEQVLAQPIGRTRWLVGRLVLAALDIALLALAAGLLAWLGARAAGVRLGLLKLLEAGANMIPIALLFLGVAALAYAIVPRASSGISYGLLAVAFCWQLVGSLLGPPRWLLELTPFAHVGLVPAQPFQATAALSLAGAGLAACTIAVAAFRRRDLLTG